MKKPFILFTVCFLLAAAIHAQTVKAPTKDTSKAGRANDRLRAAGPKDGWPNKGGKMDSIKIKKDTIAVSRIDSINRIKKNY